MPLKIQTVIERKGIFATRSVTRREWGRIVRDAMKSLLLYWHRTYLPHHFSDTARLRYPDAVKRRSRAYLKSKQKKKGHRRNLVWLGEMAQSVLGPSRITGTQKKATIFLRWGKAFRTADFRAQVERELSAINAREDRALAARIRREISIAIDAVKAEHRIRIAA